MKKTIGWMLSFFALSTMISQSLMDLTSTILVLSLLFFVFSKKSELKFSSLFPSIGIDWIWPVWLIIVIIGFAINSPGESLWLKRLVEFKWIIILYALICSFKIVQINEVILKYVNIGLLFCSGFALVTYAFQVFPFAVYSDPGRAVGFFNDPMCFAHSYGMVLCLLYGVYFTKLKSEKSLSILNTLSLILLSAAVLLSFTRGVWIGCFIALSFAAFFIGRKFGVWHFFCISLGSLAFYKLWPGFHDRVNFAMNAPKNYDNIRLVLWKTNWLIFRDYPFFGIGYGENSRHLSEYYARQGLPPDFFFGHAHNEYIHLLSGTGLLGLACYLGLFGYFFWLNLKVYRTVPITQTWHRGLLLGTLAAQIEFLIGGLTEANFEHSKVRFVVLILWSIVIWLAGEYKQSLVRKSPRT